MKKIESYECPLCGGGMIERHTRHGKLFYGCNRYPDCNGSRNADGSINCSERRITPITKKTKSFVGKVFGKITILDTRYKEGFDHSFSSILWLGKCECGKEKVFYQSHLKNGYVMSCGCDVPKCPKCGEQMHPKRRRDGNMFWGCLNYGGGCKGGREFTDDDCNAYLSEEDAPKQMRLQQICLQKDNEVNESLLCEYIKLSDISKNKKKQRQK